MPGWLRTIFTGVIVLTLVGVPCWYASSRNQRYRNFHVVQDGVLYRSGQLPRESLKRVFHDYGIRTVVTLRAAENPGEVHKDQFEEDMVKSKGMYHYRLPHQSYQEVGGKVPAEVNVERFMEIMRDPKHHPVLVHCFAGIHRTGALVAIHRIELQGWPNKKAFDEMRQHGYTVDHNDVFAYLLNYTPRGQPVSLPE